MITAVQDNDIYIIRFQYDPELIKLVKNVPGRIWVNDKKYWTIPLGRLGFLINQLKGTKYEAQLEVYSNEHLDEDATLDDTNVIPDIDLTGITFRVQTGLEPFPHQLDFMKYAIDRQRRGLHSGFILADQCGLTKTAQVMNLALYNREFNHIKHCLVIVCQNSAKYNWIEDIKKHTDGEEVPYLLGERIRRNKTIRMEGSGAEKLADLVTLHMYGKSDAPELPFFLLMNIEAIRMKKGSRYPIRQQLAALINSGYIGMIAIDEIHRNCSPTSLAGRNLLQLKREVKVPIEWIPMTGTPIVNRATDVFLPLKLVDGHTYNKYYDWCQDFCVYGGFGNHQVVAYKNVPKLKQLLQANMLRRLKSKVLSLPPKIHTIEYVENTPYQAELYKKLADERREYIQEHIREIRSMTELAVSFLRLRQVTGSPELIDKDLKIDKDYLSKNAKLIRLLEMVDDIVSGGDKVVIVSNWVEPLRTIYRFLATTYPVCCYTGTMKPEVREQHKQKFINDPDSKILIGTVPELAGSHNLPVANYLIFYDQPWNAATMQQVEERLHRPGVVGTVNIYSLIAKDTVDEKVYKMIMRKDGISNFIVDNELNLAKNPNLASILLSSASVPEQISMFD